MGFRFLHLADLHLESSFGGSPETRERLRRATLEAFERAIDYAIDRQLHAVLAAGDLYDDPILSEKVWLRLERQLARLEEAGVWFVAVCGNHDPGGPGFRSPGLGLGGERCHIFRTPTPEALTITDRDGRPIGVVVGAGHASDREAENLAARFERQPGSLPTVGLLHTNLEAASGAADHDRYAPSTRADYERLDYSYWALGHIHKRQRAVEGLPVFYPGNLQGRNPRETGEKGGYLVEAHAGDHAEPDFVRLAPVRWEHLRVDDLAEATTPGQLASRLAQRIAELRGGASDELAVRVELGGETPLADKLRRRETLAAIEEDVASHCGALEVQLRAANVTRPIDRQRLRDSPTLLAHALALIDRAVREPSLLAELAPAELARVVPDGDAARLDYLRELLVDLPDELIERSLGESA